MPRIVLAFAAAILGLAAMTAGAGAEPVVTGVEVQAPDNLTVGDRFHLLVRLEAEKGTEVSIAAGALPIAFEVTNTPSPQRRSLPGGREEIIFDLEVAVFLPGDVPVPPIEVAYQEPDGITGSVLTPAALVIVESVLDPSAPLAPRGLKPQLEVGSAGSAAIFFTALGVVLAVLAVVVLLIYRSTRPRRQPAMALETADMGPEDRARVVLEAAGAAFERDRDFVTYYGAIAVTVRNYLTERYGFHAFALTTRELNAEMGRRGIDRWQARLVNGLLTQCDAAVYARYQPALERAGHDLTAAFEIVEMSRPRPYPETTETSLQEAPEEQEVGTR